MSTIFPSPQSEQGSIDKVVVSVEPRVMSISLVTMKYVLRQGRLS